MHVEMEKNPSWVKYLLILGAALTLSLTLSPHPAQAQADSRAGPSGDETRRDGSILMTSISPLKSFDRLPHSTSPLNIVLPPSAPLSIRSKPNNLRERILIQARYYVGTPYRRGSSLHTSHSTDCSGFVQFIYKKCDINLPRSSREQAREGTIVAHTLNFAIMRPGDLLFFGHGGRYIGHVGIYLGDGNMIHASSRRRGVIITDLRQPSHGGFVVAKRLFELQYSNDQTKYN
jgi:cell wall-associated NlpC family hydrolase